MAWEKADGKDPTCNIYSFAYDTTEVSILDHLDGPIL